MYNEAAALQLIANNTSIRVPKVISYEERDQGYYLTTSLIDGIELPTVGDECRRPGQLSHSGTGKCSTCQSVADENATDYIKNVVLPELGRLTVDESGLNGASIPSPWVTQHDARESWPVKRYQTHLVFCHGDLGPWNIMIDSQTLDIAGVIDWENAGYCHKEYLEYWTVSLEEYYAWYNDKRTLDNLVQELE